MRLVDELAFITATRFARKSMVTVSSDKINFTRPIRAGAIIKLTVTVGYMGKPASKLL